MQFANPVVAYIEYVIKKAFFFFIECGISLQVFCTYDGDGLDVVMRKMSSFYEIWKSKSLKYETKMITGIICIPTNFRIHNDKNDVMSLWSKKARNSTIHRLPLREPVHIDTINTINSWSSNSYIEWEKTQQTFSIWIY